MKIDVTQPIKNLDGSIVLRRFLCDKCQKETPPMVGGNILTLRIVLENALTRVLPNAPPLDGSEHVERYNLALTIHNNDEVDLTHEQCAKLQKLVATIYPPLTAGQTHLMLERTDDA